MESWKKQSKTRFRIVPVPPDESIKQMQTIAIEVYRGDPFQRRNNTPNVWARYAIVAVLIGERKRSMGEIAGILGYTNHGSACHAWKVHGNLNEVDATYKTLFKQFTEKLCALREVVVKLVTPEKFIEALQESDEYLEHIYMMGSCYRFHKLLATIFESVECYIAVPYKDHVVSKINGKLYDIRGMVPERHEFLYRPIYPEEIERAETWSFRSKALLKVTDCPNCDEPINYEQPNFLKHG